MASYSCSYQTRENPLKFQTEKIRAANEIKIELWLSTSIWPEEMKNARDVYQQDGSGAF